jgi:hypothetical protein
MDIIPNYENIKIRNTSTGSKYTQQKIQRLRNKDELKFLYIKRGKSNQDTTLHTLESCKGME